MFDQLIYLCDLRQYRELKTRLKSMNPVDIAEFISELENEQALIIFRLLAKDMAADVFSELDSDIGEFIISSFSDKEIKNLINDLYVDDAVDLIEDLPANVVKRVLKNAGAETRKMINEFLNYGEDTVGSIMTAEFAELKAGMTVRQAVERIRLTGIDLETIYICYVTDASRVLVGVVSFKDMLYADENDKIGDIMDRDVKFLYTSDDRELAADCMSKYSFLAMPAVDHEDRLVGIVTIDDAIDVIEREDSEDFQKMAGMVPTETPYLKTGVMALFKSRIVWLLVLMVSGMVSGTILSSFEHAIAAVPLLVAFMPMLTDTGGNAGSQSSTTVIRAMALGEIGPESWLKVLGKEIGAALIAGGGIAAVNFVRMLIMYRGTPNIMACAGVVSFCVVMIVVMSNVMGALLPMLARRVKIDPALVAGPLITTAIDILGILMYFSVASAVLLK